MVARSEDRVDDAGGRDETAGTSLPRRSPQHHLEPQLREPGGGGDGTPFAAFADPASTDDAGESGSSAAAFQRGTGRGPAAD